jgi:hypothetical protein
VCCWSTASFVLPIRFLSPAHSSQHNYSTIPSVCCGCGWRAACIENEREKTLKEIAKMGCRNVSNGDRKSAAHVCTKGVCGCYAAVRARIHLICRASNGVFVPLAVV